MESLDLLEICASAFVGVFLLLTVLALVMRLIIVLFPERESAGDSAMIAAVIEEATVCTCDMGSTSTTLEVAEAVAAKMSQMIMVLRDGQLQTL